MIDFSLFAILSAFIFWKLLVLDLVYSESCDLSWKKFTFVFTQTVMHFRSKITLSISNCREPNNNTKSYILGWLVWCCNLYKSFCWWCCVWAKTNQRYQRPWKLSVSVSYYYYYYYFCFVCLSVLFSTFWSDGSQNLMSAESLFNLAPHLLRIAIILNNKQP